MLDRASFDYYYTWLGIPPSEQPPNHYRLLGLELYESDPAVIAATSDCQLAAIKSRESTNHAVAQQLLYESALARLCLLNVQTKAVYDDQLRKAQEAEVLPSIAPPPIVDVGGLDFDTQPLPYSVPRSGRTAKRQSSNLGAIVAVVLGAVTGIPLAILILERIQAEPVDVPQPAAEKHIVIVDPPPPRTPRTRPRPNPPTPDLTTYPPMPQPEPTLQPTPSVVAPVVPNPPPRPAPSAEWKIALPSGESLTASSIRFNVDEMRKLFADGPPTYARRHREEPASAVFAVGGEGNDTILDGPGVVRLDERGEERRLLVNYADNHLHGTIKVWDRDNKPLYYAEYKKGQPAGLLCVFEDAVPLAIEKWVAGKRDSYLVERDGDRYTAIATAELDDEKKARLTELAIKFRELDPWLKQKQIVWRTDLKKWSSNMRVRIDAQKPKDRKAEADKIRNENAAARDTFFSKL